MACIIIGSRLRELNQLLKQARNGHEPVEQLPPIGVVARRVLSDVRELRGRRYERDDIQSANEIDPADNKAGV